MDIIINNENELTPNEELVLVCVCMDELTAIAKKQNRPIYELIDDIIYGIPVTPAKQMADIGMDEFLPHATE